MVGEYHHTKKTRAKKTKKQAWHWDTVNQKTLDNIKATIARDAVLAYTDNSKEFEIYTDTLKKLGAVIIQGNRPIAFFSRKLTLAKNLLTHVSIRSFQL